MSENRYTAYDYLKRILTCNNQGLGALIHYLPLYNFAMDALEYIPWIALGFVPTFAAMEVAWRMAKRRQAKMLGETQVRI